MTYLAHITIYPADGVRYVRAVHSPRIVEYAYALALDACRIRTQALSRLNIMQAARSRLKPPHLKVGELDLAFDLERIDRLGDQEADKFFVNLIHRGMKILERAAYIPKGSSERVRKEVRRLGLRIRSDMTKWRRNARTRDAFRLMARTTHKGICIDAEVKRKGGGLESFHLLDSWYPPHFFCEYVLDSVRWLAADKIEVVLSHRGRNTQHQGVRRIDTRRSQNKPSITADGRTAKLHFSLKKPIPAETLEDWKDVR
ncbi:hypothetical protein GCM10011487_20340 [Steroidobacter agaridevorans]|uniref:Uncharacterized protein n=1 Tax=Steroidobacter agaridevorans TaxID=2695856 RepID=A0A829Y9K8_9GAMM|nr:hypothetical protein [Steroidobacter agaridevorans]GFE80034.1 hypothetical protein GCM10011487_20340 [Steroidobacter agaridevorans]GFE89996.1 hypothetical protein GCM10011488_49500 [Steroidobacter agaridevorans]